MAELNLIIQSDHLDLYEPRGLVTLAMVLIATTLNVRIGKEMRAIKFCDFKYVYNADGSLAYLVYAPDTSKKDKGDVKTAKHLVFKTGQFDPHLIEPQFFSMETEYWHDSFRRFDLTGYHHDFIRVGKFGLCFAP